MPPSNLLSLPACIATLGAITIIDIHILLLLGSLIHLVPAVHSLVHLQGCDVPGIPIQVHIIHVIGNLATIQLLLLYPAPYIVDVLPLYLLHSGLGIGRVGMW